MKFSQLILEAKFTNGKFFGNLGAGILPFCSTTKNFLINLRSSRTNESNTYGVWGGAINIENPSVSEIKKEALRELQEESQFKGKMNLISSFVFSKSNFKYYNFIGIVKKEFIPKLDLESSGFKWINLKEIKYLPNLHFGLKALINSSKFKEQIKKL